MSKRRINPAFVAQLKRQNPTLTRRELGKLLAERVGRSTVYTDEYIGKLRWRAAPSPAAQQVPQRLRAPRRMMMARPRARCRSRGGSGRWGGLNDDLGLGGRTHGFLRVPCVLAPNQGRLAAMGDHDHLVERTDALALRPDSRHLGGIKDPC